MELAKKWRVHFCLSFYLFWGFEAQKRQKTAQNSQSHCEVKLVLFRYNHWCEADRFTNKNIQSLICIKGLDTKMNLSHMAKERFRTLFFSAQSGMSYPSPRCPFRRKGLVCDSVYWGSSQLYQDDQWHPSLLCVLWRTILWSGGTNIQNYQQQL